MLAFVFRRLAQAVLVSHLDMIVEVLNFLGIPHEDGFFAKDLDAKPHLTEGWEARTFENVILADKTHLTAIAVGGPMPQQYIDAMARFIDANDVK